MSAGRRTRASGVLGCLLGFAVLCLAAASGPSAAFIVPQRGPPTSEDGPLTPSKGRALSGWDFWTGIGDAQEMSTGLSVVVFSVITVAVAVGVVLLVRSVVAASRARREQLEERPAEARNWNRVRASADVGAATARAIEQLDTGQAADAITTYWQAVQAAGAEAGLPRESWQTSSEYAARLVTELGVTPQAITVVTELFREVRFSQHQLEPESVELVRSALSLIRADLGDPATSTTEGVQ